MASKDLKNMDLNTLHELPTPLKLGLSALLIAAILGAGYFFVFQDQLSQLDDAKKQEETLKETYKTKSIQAANLKSLQQELEVLNKSFNVLLRQLPTDAEIPNLIQELHQAASSNGMRLSALTPQAVITDEYVQTLPYELVISGQYNQIAQFVRDIGGLSRIITLSALNLSKDEKTGQITLKAIASTYKALSEAEITAKKAAQDPNNNGNAQPPQQQ